jgi:hypothetical protein
MAGIHHHCHHIGIGGLVKLLAKLNEKKKKM